MNAARALSFLFLYEFSLLVCAESNHTAATTSDGKQVMVGWTAGPTQRGTVMLVYGCLSTIFASTWTVLHLNVPHPYDGVWTRTLRKIKWMAITILFPEFIFSKAVCELRLAVADLYAMHVELEKARVVRSTTIELWDGIIHRNWTWKAEFGPWMRLLYKLLRLPPLKGSRSKTRFRTAALRKHINLSEKPIRVTKAMQLVRETIRTNIHGHKLAIGHWFTRCTRTWEDCDTVLIVVFIGNLG